MANNDYDEFYDDSEERDKALASLSMADRIKYKKFENEYEIDKQSGGEVPEDKHQYILSQIFKSRR